MMKSYLATALLLMSFFTQANNSHSQESLTSASQAPATEAIHQVLNQYHQAAAQADGEMYFGLMTEDAIFLGTDKTERWTKEQFVQFAMPYFKQGRGWTYTPKKRHVTVMLSGEVAFFDEVLENKKYGMCRGSGVLVNTESGWRISQYNLAILVPNDVADKVIKQIKAFEQ